MIDFSTVDNNTLEHFKNFITKKRKFNFVELKYFFKSKNPKILICNNKTDNLKFFETLNLIEGNKKDILIFVHISLEGIVKKSGFKSISFPINYIKFVDEIELLYSNKEPSFSFVVLTADSILCNSKNNEQVYVTETEYKIIELLFLQISATRKEIKENILNLQDDIETKSLDSHLSRIRKKFIQIKSNIKIVSFNSETIKIEN